MDRVESPIETMHRDNSPASATPVTDGNWVYTVFCVDEGLLVSAVNFDGKLHILSDEGVFRCYDAASGKVLNERRGVGSVKASMVANERHIYVTEVSGRTTVIENNEHWRVVAVNELGEPVVSSMAISDGDLLLRGEEHLFLVRDPAASVK